MALRNSYVLCWEGFIVGGPGSPSFFGWSLDGPWRVGLSLDRSETCPGQATRQPWLGQQHRCDQQMPRNPCMFIMFGMHYDLVPWCLCFMVSVYDTHLCNIAKPQPSKQGVLQVVASWDCGHRVGYYVIYFV